MIRNLTDLEVWTIVWPLLFGVAGVSFLYLLLANRDERWWAIIPRTVLLSLAAVIVLE